MIISPSLLPLMGRTTQASRIAEVTTDSSVTPTTTHLTTVGLQDTIRVLPGACPVNEPSFFLYVRVNGGTAKKVQLYRHTGRLISVGKNAVVSLGTSDGRSVKVIACIGQSGTETPSGSSGDVTCDRAGPPLWSPSKHHIELPAFHSAVRVTSTTRKILFVSEFDGVAWTPERFYVLPANKAITIRCTFKRIAFATYDGATVSVTGPSGTSIGGTSTRMSFNISATGTTHTVAAGSESDLRAKIAIAVAGDEIVLPAGTYTLTANVTDATFAANELAGRQGAEGIVIRGATGNPADVIVAPNNNASGWHLSQNGATLPTYIKGITFNIAGTVAFCRFSSGIFRLEDVRVTGTNSSGTNPSLTFESASGPLDFRALRVQVDDSVEDCFDGNGNGSDSLGVSIAQLIDCVGFDSGTTNDNQQVLTTHNGLRLEVWGGEFYDARLNVVETDSNPTSIVHCFFGKFHDGASARRAGMGGFTAFFIESESGAAADAFTPKAGTYSIGSDVIRSANASGNSIIRYASTSGVAPVVIANRIQANDGRAMFPSDPIFTAEFNLIADGGEGIRIQNSAGPSAQRIFLHNNTIDSCPTALSFGDTNNTPITMYNQATKGSTTGINTTASHQAATITDYNTIDPTIDTDFVAGANDTVSGDAALDTDYLPTAAGNCDDNGSPTLYDWVGGIDVWGWPVLYKAGVSPRGARSRPIVRSGAELLPEAWV